MQTTNPSLLSKLYCKSDLAAWSRFVKLYGPLVHAWVGKLGIDEPDRSDVAQDVFVVLLEKMPSFQYDAKHSFRGWLRTITINKCRDLFRRRHRSTEPQLMEQMERATTEDSDGFGRAEYQTYVAGKALQLMRDCFAENTWRACWEHVVEGRSAIDIGAELKMTPNAVYLARARVLKRLRDELAGLWD